MLHLQSCPVQRRPAAGGGGCSCSADGGEGRSAEDREVANRGAAGRRLDLISGAVAQQQGWPAILCSVAARGGQVGGTRGEMRERGYLSIQGKTERHEEDR